VDLLISYQLVLMQQYDVHLAHSMENGMNYPAVVFAMQLVQRFCTDIDRLTVRAQEVSSVHSTTALDLSTHTHTRLLHYYNHLTASFPGQPG